MDPVSRRTFLKTGAIGAGAFAAGGIPALAGPAATLAASDRVTLGKSGVVVSRLAQGTGMKGWARQSDHTRMGQKAFTALLRRGFEQGINLWDMADLYGTHSFMRKAMDGIARDQYSLLSKIWTREAKWNHPSGGATEEVHRFLKEMGTDRLDICLLHCMTEKDWPKLKERACEELATLKTLGKVRAVGVSCHSHDALKTAAEHPWVDVILARINHMGGKEYKMDGTVEEITATLKKARANGKAVIGMKIFGEGRLVKPAEKDASLKYVLNSGAVDAITIGMRTVEEVDDSVRRVAKALRG
ncbi:MAG: aldo/keto reductase [Verrucomicrobiales bacterium]|nr:aldo/keto reductase [Verrucomicrobiota bacterium JB025]